MLKEILDGLKTLVGGRGGDTDEKRRLIRLKCRYPVTCSLEKRAFLATVVDMGLQGMRLEFPERVKAGQEIHVTYNSDAPTFTVDTVRCRAAWCRKGRAGKIEVGVRYEETPANLEHSWVKVILRELGFDEKSIFQRRRQRRAVAMLPAHVDRGTGRVAARVLNLGVGGALLQAEDFLDKGQRLTLEIGPALGLPILVARAEVVNCRYEPQSRSWFAGLRFRDLGGRQLDLLSRYLVNLLGSAAG